MSKKSKKPEEVKTEIPLPSPEEGTTICGVVRHLGGDYVLVRCIDGYERKARIPGKLRKKVWIIEGDIVLVGLWGAGSDKCDLVHKYSKSEVNTLVERGIIPKEFVDALSGLT
ncbi:MAG: translation initiation factor aIF-1A [Desulfurococcaceae archaeon]|nr:translation initiation factor aIF-1A [Desulfurococcaceae archaeon]MCC6052844.1 translation initiation factor aIF-1A [Desulfurococcaceae archaeon]